VTIGNAKIIKAEIVADNGFIRVTDMVKMTNRTAK
jgi:hypothetical protein